MFRISCLLGIFLFMMACSQRGHIAYGKAAPGATLVDIWVAKFRSDQPPALGQTLPPRPAGMTFQKEAVSIPQTHQTGKIEWPDGLPDAQSDFVTLSTQAYPTLNGFAAQVAHNTDRGSDEVMLFVHGYNYTHGEAVYLLAQMAYDFKVPAPTVLFSWPSAGKSVGYLYDRDSVLIARDQLEKVIIALTKQRGKKLLLVGHSLGNFLIMETLRQIEITGSVNIRQSIDTLVMLSPDIDGELFYTQASRLRQVPDPSIIVAVSEDRALRLSAFLTGRTNRLGSETDKLAIRDLPITVVDASGLSNSISNHNVAMTSPAAISILTRMGNGARLWQTNTPRLINLAGAR